MASASWDRTLDLVPKGSDRLYAVDPVSYLERQFVFSNQGSDILEREGETTKHI